MENQQPLNGCVAFFDFPEAIHLILTVYTSLRTLGVHLLLKLIPEGQHCPLVYDQYSVNSYVID